MKQATCSFSILIGSLLALVVGMYSQAQNAAVGGMILKNTEPSEFHATPVMPQCFLGAMQRINEKTGGAVFLIRADEQTGCVVPSHWHTSGEQITVVSGIVTIRMNNGKSFQLKEGGYAYVPSRHVHSFSCSGPCLHFVQSDGPYDVHYVNNQGKEISLAEALQRNQ